MTVLAPHRRIGASCHGSANETGLRTAGTRAFSVRIRAICVLTLGLFAFSGCAFGDPPAEETGEAPNLPTPSVSPTSEDGQASVVTAVLATGLAVPWAVDFLPDGTALITERDSRRILSATSTTPTSSSSASSSAASPSASTETASALTITPIQTIDDAVSATAMGVSSGESGLLGLAVSPSYDTDKTVFIYYTTSQDNRIAKLVLGQDPQPIVTGIPKSTTRNGGCLHFGADGYLYASTGDSGDGSLAQDTQSLAGKILRMTTDGAPAPGNPFGNLVYSYGHRDIEGFAWNSAGVLYAVESGETTVDEINLIEAGKNYGWPTIEGNGTDSTLTNPIATLPFEEANCSGVAIVSDVLITGCLRGQRLWMVQLTTTGTALGAATAILTDTHGRLRSVTVAADDTVWVTTSNRDGQGTPQQDDDLIMKIIIGNVGDAGKT